MATSQISPNSLAVATAVGVENVQHVPIAETLPRRILIYGMADPSLEDDTYETGKLYLVTSPEDVGARFGFGFEVYRLAKWAFLGSQGIETWVLVSPQEGYNGTPSQAYGYVQVTASGVLAGTLHLYIAGEYIPVIVNDDDTASQIEAAIVAAVNADKTLGVTGSTSAPIADAANIIAKDKSTYGNYIKISFNEKYGEEFPVGVSVAITQLTSGTGSISNALEDLFEPLGLDDEQNEKYFTDFISSAPVTGSAFLNAVSNWNGVGNDFIGNYAKTVQRPLRSLYGDTVAGSTGLNNLITLGDGRKLDRTHGVIAVPGSPNHPQEIAALALGIAANVNNNNAAESYVDKVLVNVLPGVPEDRWTSKYSSKDTAVKAGISPTIYEDSAIKMQNLVTFYHPDNVPSSSNGYRSMRAISVMQNISNSTKVNFKQEKWQRISIVENVDNVNDIIARQKVKDTRAVENDIVALANAWQNKSWLYSASFTIDRIKKGGYVQIRPGGTGFDMIIPIVISGESWITDSIIQFDTALTVFTQ